MKEVNNQIETDNLSQENVNANKRNISEGMDLVKQREKLIKLADSSDAGWRVVDEYIANPLADDSDDEKIHKAQSRADSKIKKEKLKKKVDFKTTPYSYKKTASTVGNPIPVTTNAAFRPGRSFFCNERGHWRRKCSKVAAEQRSNLNKISIEHYVNNDKSSTPLFTTDISHDIKVSSNTHYTNNESNVIQKTTGVGRLRKSVNKWKEIGANDFIVDVIENGYQIPFLTLPNQIELDNNKSARDNPDFVTDEINKLLEKGCISLVTDKPHVINPLTVANNGS
jgi:hypothetical protein